MVPRTCRWMVFAYIAWLGMACQRGVANENWPQWRGPTGHGLSDAKNLPTSWDLANNENIIWKVELPAWSGSTPVIWGDYIFLTSPAKSDGSTPPQDLPGRGSPPGKGFGGKGFEGKGFGGKGFGDKGFGGKASGGRGGSVSRPNDPGG